MLYAFGDKRAGSFGRHDRERLARSGFRCFTLDMLFPSRSARWVSIKRREAAVRAPIGVNIAGFLSSEKGVGEAVRSTVRILDAEGIPYVLNNVRDPGSVNKDTSTSGFAIANPHAVNLVHVNPDALPYFLSQRGQHYFKNHYNIAYWPWELDTFPVEWRSAFRH